MSDTPTPRTDAERIASGHEGTPASYLHHAFCEEIERELAEAKLEIDVLRRYGSKYCTAMADEELSNLRNPTTP